MTTPLYMQEGWFAMLHKRADRPGAVRARIAQELGISASALSQVLNGSGCYGSGTASTAHIADKVVRTFGRYVCPHLTDEAGGAEQIVAVEQCRAYAHRGAPSSPREMKHWQACQRCPHKAISAPPAQRIPQQGGPGKVIPIAKRGRYACGL